MDAFVLHCYNGGGSFLAYEDFWRMFNHSFPACAFFCFLLKWRLPHAHWFHSSYWDQSTVAQRAEMTVAKCSLTKCLSARFWIGTQTLPWQRLSQPTPSSSGQGFMHVYLHFWQNDQGLFTHHCANTGVERTPNKSHHTKLTLKKKILPPPLLGPKLTTLRSWAQRS